MGMSIAHWRLVLGHIVNPIDDNQCDFYPKGALLLENSSEDKEEYKIVRIGLEDESWVREYRLRTDSEVFNFRGQIIIPSFFDLHFHWVQDEVRLKPKDSLLEWLSQYAWPCEEQFADKEFAEKKAQQFFPFLAKVGTLGGAVYSSLHSEALEAAFNNAEGDFVIGNVLMTMNSPKGLSQSEENAVSLLEKYTKKYGKRYAVTPRFAPTTHPNIMELGGKLAKQWGSFIQTHLSENRSEIDYVLSLYRQFLEFKDVKSYTEIYHQVGLLTPRTIMGHAIHLSNEEWQILAETGTALAHCPTSNAPFREKGLGSGLFDLLSANKFGVRWALASDIGGGPYPSMWDVIRCFVSHHRRAHRQVSYIQGLFRSTLASAEILGMGSDCGNLCVGKWANLVVMDFPSQMNGSLNSVEKLLEKLVKSKHSRDDWDQGEVAVIYKGKIIATRCGQRR